MGNKNFFGGNPILMTGDWRQTLLILKGFKVPQIIESVLKRSNMWSTITKLQLKQNMRADTNQLAFQSWLGLIGDGIIPKYVTKAKQNTDLIPIDDKVVIHRDRNKKHQQPMIQDLIESCHVAIEHSYRHGYINPEKQDTIYTDNIVLNRFLLFYVNITNH